MDSGRLSIRLCERLVAEHSSASPDEINEPCCACEEAKYEVIFEGRVLHNKLRSSHSDSDTNLHLLRSLVKGAPPQGLPCEQVAAALLGHHRGVAQRRVQVRGGGTLMLPQSFALDVHFP